MTPKMRRSGDFRNRGPGRFAGSFAGSIVRPPDEDGGKDRRDWSGGAPDRDGGEKRVVEENEGYSSGQKTDDAAQKDDDRCQDDLLALSLTICAANRAQLRRVPDLVSGLQLSHMRHICEIR